MILAAVSVLFCTLIPQWKGAFSLKHINDKTHEVQPGISQSLATTLTISTDNSRKSSVKDLHFDFEQLITFKMKKHGGERRK